jgi:GNAT superfamily N-acetyltransferase
MNPSVNFPNRKLNESVQLFVKWLEYHVKLTVLPVTPERWTDLEAIFKAKGCSVARGCWCMAYRRSGSQAQPPPGSTRAEVNRTRLKRLVDAGRPPGLIGYRGKVPVGWVSIGPREDYAKLARSPIMKPIDDQPVWSVVCFVVPAQYRGHGVAQALLAGAVAYAKKHGAKLIEAYPVDKPSRSKDDSMWFGAKSMYDKAGFSEVARWKPQRPVVRLRPS